MQRIIPAIIPQTVDDIRTKTALLGGSAEWVQIDITDGLFAPTTTWPYTGGSPLDLAGLGALPKLEIHLMIEHPEKVLHDWVRAGASRLLIHAESTKEFGVILDSTTEMNIEMGVVINLETPIDVIEPWVDRVSLVQLMSIAEIGSYGEPFSDAVIPKIESLRLRYPDLTIEVDGGVTPERARQLFDLGVTNVVMGSAIFSGSDPRATLLSLHNATSSR